MLGVQFFDRDMSDLEYQRELTGFEERGLEFGNPPEKTERFGFVATDQGKFVGASSGLAQKRSDRYESYFYLSDLYVEKGYRGSGCGKELLNLLEEKIKALGIEYIWTWTAAFEAATFYQKQGYQVFATFEKFYLSGHARVGLIKKLSE